MNKHILSASAMLLILITTGCGGGQKGTDSDSIAAIDSIYEVQALEAAALSDSLARQDSILSADSVRINQLIEGSNLAALLEAYDQQCTAVYNEFDSTGYPLGEHPLTLKLAIRLRTRLQSMESRMSPSQKALYDSVTGHIRRFL